MSQINTQPADAKVYINGRYVGQSPVQTPSSHGFGHRYHVQITKEGYQPQDFYLDSRMSWTLGYVSLVTMGIPLLWAWSLDREYDFKLPALGEAPPATKAQD